MKIIILIIFRQIYIICRFFWGNIRTNLFKLYVSIGLLYVQVFGRKKKLLELSSVSVSMDMKGT